MGWKSYVTLSDEVLSGQSGIFAVSLDAIHKGTAPEVYKDPIKFISKTYFTPNLKTIIREVFKALYTDEPTHKIINLVTSFGGGKTHTLATLYHLIKNYESL